MSDDEKQQHYILGDWGTTSCRLYLCQGDKIIDEVKAPGAKFTNDLQAEYVDAVHSWTSKYGKLTGILCGMVGSNIGWVETDYISCPAQSSMLMGGVKQLETSVGPVHILPGVNTASNLLEHYDVMRGEETQIFGWLKAAKRQDGILCLPGTHTKWVKINDGKIVNFITSFTGELFEVLKQNSILVGAQNLPQTEIDEAFNNGVVHGAKANALTHLLFSVRSNQILKMYSPKQSQNYMLGLIIGQDIHAAKKLLGAFPDVIIGGDGPASFNLEAIKILGGTSVVLSSQEASLQGLQSMHEEIKSI